MRDWLILDIATAALPDAERYLEGTVRAPGNYKDPVKIAEAIAEKTAERIRMAATDVDLARITGFGMWHDALSSPSVVTLKDEPSEAAILRAIANDLRRLNPMIITFGGFSFDLPLLMRRARYLGIDFPKIDLDRFRSPHVDLCEILSDRNNDRKRSLQFYVKRLGWDISKTLTGAEEAQVPTTGKWDELAASLDHDVTATHRLAKWLEIISEQEPLL